MKLKLHNPCTHRTLFVYKSYDYSATCASCMQLANNA